LTLSGSENPNSGILVTIILYPVATVVNTAEMKFRELGAVGGFLVPYQYLGELGLKTKG